MTTRLDKTLKREITVDGRPFIVALSPDGVKLTQKGKRIGQELRWVDLVSGDAALAVALKASIWELAGEAPKKATSEPRRTPKAPPRGSTGRRARDGRARTAEHEMAVRETAVHERPCTREAAIIQSAASRRRGGGWVLPQRMALRTG